MIYYISDLHLGDSRIMELCKRPFVSLDDYRETLIKKWNSKVQEDDVVYVLGDIGNGSIEVINSFFGKVGGHLHLIVGNHDEPYLIDLLVSRVFETISEIKYVVDQNRKVCLCHYPIMDWFSGKEIIYHIYGHIHNKNSAKNGEMYAEIKNYYRNKPAFNASVDVINYEPVTLDELIKLKEENAYETFIN